MDGYLVKAEKEGEGATMDATATLQQMLANSGVLMSQLQLLSNAGDGSTGAAAASLPWMAVSPYQVMVLPQSLLAAQNIAATTQDGQIVLAPSAIADGHVLKTEQASASVLDQAVAALLQKQHEAAQKNQSTSAAANAVNMAALQHLKRDNGRDGEPNAKIAKLDGELGIKPPKKPLTPYMTFSKMVWPHVKATHPHLSSVVEIGAVVGSMWRDLDPVEKQNYIEQFTREKLVYDEELHVYLKSTGLQASDLIKPKVKKKDIHHRSGTSTVVSPAHRQPNQMKTAATVSANGGTAGGGLTVAGQQLVQTLMGLQAPAAGTNATAATAASQSLQQLLQQLGLSGQTVYANSDGTISVDGSILTIQGQPVHLAGQTAAYGDQSQFLTTSVAAATDTTAATVDGTRSLAWHQPTTASSASQQDGQPGVVVYQLPASNGTVAAAGSADGLLAAAATDGGSQQANATAPVYYSVDQFGQLVRHETRPAGATAAASNAEENRLQLEIITLQSALEQKTREADDLRAQLAEVYGVIERYKTDAAAANGTAGVGCSTDDDSAATTTAAAAAAAAVAVKDETKTVSEEANGGLGPVTTSS